MTAHAIIVGQLEPSAIRNPALIEAFETIDRAAYLPEAYRGVASVDEAIPLSADRCAMEPLVLAKLLEEADISPEDHVLIIGSATGYSAAMASFLAKDVVALEEQRGMVDQARKAMGKNQCKNVEFAMGGFASGWAAKAPYDRIIIEGGVQCIPDAIFEQLKEGGVLVTVLQDPSAAGARSGLGTLMRCTRMADRVDAKKRENLFAHALPGFEKRTAFAL